MKSETKKARAEPLEVLTNARKVPLCDVLVIGIRGDGHGIYIDWTGTTASSACALIAMAQKTVADTLVSALDAHSANVKKKNRL